MPLNKFVHSSIVSRPVVHTRKRAITHLNKDGNNKPHPDLSTPFFAALVGGAHKTTGFQQMITNLQKQVQSLKDAFAFIPSDVSWNL